MNATTKAMQNLLDAIKALDEAMANATSEELDAAANSDQYVELFQVPTFNQTVIEILDINRAA